MSHRYLRLVAGLGTLALASALSAQTPAPQGVRDAARPIVGTAAVTGTITSDDETHRPVRRALVRLSSGDLRDERATATDDHGQFVFADLPAAHYSISATKPGYCASYYGAKVSWRGPSSPVTVTDGQRLNVAMKILHGAVIAGTIVDAFGRPEPGVRVVAMQYRTVGGVRRLDSFGSSAAGPTNDLGEYRIYGLSPGEYAVAASSSGPSNTEMRVATNDEIQWALRQLQHPGQATPGLVGANPPPPPSPAMGYAPIYFPGTADSAAATTVTLAASEEHDGVDFPLQLVATSKIDGTLSDVDGKPAPAVALSLVAKQVAFMFAPFSGRGQSDGRGHFVFSGVTPGDYVLIVRSMGRGEGPPPVSGAGGARPARQVFWAQQDVSVRGDDVTGLSLHLQPSLSVGGRMVFQGTTPPPQDLSTVRLNLNPAPSPGTTTTVTTGGGAPPEINADGTFTLYGATPGRYRLNASVPSPPATGPARATAIPTWLAESVVSGGVETLDSALDISTTDVSGVVVTFTDHPTELSGRLLDAAGKPAPEYWVVAFTTDRTYWTAGSRRVRTLRPDAEGKYRVIGLPPGEYYMVALTDIDQVDMTDTAFLEQLAAASLKITLADGEKKTQDLKLSGGWRP